MIITDITTQEEIDSYLFHLVNKTETFDELKEAIKEIGRINDGVVEGRSKPWPTDKQAEYVDTIIEMVREGKQRPLYNLLTRTYGIKQQMMYLIYYGT